MLPAPLSIHQRGLLEITTIHLPEPAIPGLQTLWADMSATTLPGRMSLSHCEEQPVPRPPLESLNAGEEASEACARSCTAVGQAAATAVVLLGSLWPSDKCEMPSGSSGFTSGWPEPFHSPLISHLPAP